ncbi:MAG: hypothetical protein PHH26_07790, partial [Candidatus Thermoplasmatota archaeon]|nr:hypothetical protein [Candidatus Thermoplasmatota archaeon]
MLSKITFFLLSALSSFAATVYVDSATGSDVLNDGTPLSPFKTIAKGIANASFTDGRAYVAVKRVANPNLGYTFETRTVGDIALGAESTIGTFTNESLSESDIGKLLQDY